MAETIHLRTCPLCEAMCGLEIKVEDGKVGVIRAGKEDVWSKGYLCPKGTTLGQLHEGPDRLRHPMIRGIPVDVAPGLNPASTGSVTR